MSETVTVKYRGLITASAILAMLMQTLDSTIANVALPYMQGSMSSSADEITWVLTSYVIAAAIMTAPVGWMARRFGRKKLFIGSLAGFTVASMACGAAQSLEQLVLFRLIQGMCGAAIAPLSQATMLDIYPFSQRAQAMAIFSMGVTMGPVMGPTLGGYLTEMFNWRYVFYVNLPFGILAMIGLALFMPRDSTSGQFALQLVPDYACWRSGCGSLQLMLDRGQELGWFTVAGNPGGGGDRGHRFLFVHRSHDHFRQTIPVVGIVHRPQFQFRDGDGVLRVVGDAGIGRVAGAILAEPGGVSGGHGGLGDGTARHRYHGVDVPRGATGNDGRSSAKSWRSGC